MSPAARKEVAKVLRRLRRKLTTQYRRALNMRDYNADSAYSDAINMVDAELAKLEPKRRTKR